MDMETPTERNCVPIGRHYAGPLNLDLDKLLAGRLLIQGTSGAGKSATLRRIIEEAFEYMTTVTDSTSFSSPATCPRPAGNREGRFAKCPSGTTPGLLKNWPISHECLPMMPPSRTSESISIAS